MAVPELIFKPHANEGLHIIIAEAYSASAYLVRAVGFEYASTDYLRMTDNFVCTELQMQIVKLLHENDFIGFGGKVFRSGRKGNPIEVADAVAAIKRGDYILEKFTEALDS